MHVYQVICISFRTGKQVRRFVNARSMSDAIWTVEKHGGYTAVTAEKI